jgi:mono/diheme cytochrome c family protein
MRAPVVLAALVFATGALAETPVERGKYLVQISGCSDCHTPGGMLGQADPKRYLGGSDVGFGDPASGVWIGGNLTPDKETGLGKWSKAEIVTAITKGKRPDGRELSAIMPWPGLSHLTPEDADAIAAFLQSLPPVNNPIPGPYKAGETPALPYVSTVIPTAQYVKLPKP